MTYGPSVNGNKRRNWANKSDCFHVFVKIMPSIRDSLSHFPNAVGNLISGSSSHTMPPSPTIDEMALSMENHSFGSASMSGDDTGSEKSHAIPSSLIKEQWQLILDQDASIDELTNAIERCKELVLSTDECTNERKWLVRHLVELRFRLREMEDAISDSSKRCGSKYKVRVAQRFSTSVCRISNRCQSNRWYSAITLSTITPRVFPRQSSTVITAPESFGVSSKRRTSASIAISACTTNAWRMSYGFVRMSLHPNEKRLSTKYVPRMDYHFSNTNVPSAMHHSVLVSTPDRHEFEQKNQLKPVISAAVSSVNQKMWNVFFIPRFIQPF